MIDELEKKRREMKANVAKKMNTLGAGPLSKDQEDLIQKFIDGEIDYEELYRRAVSGEY